MNRHPTPRPPFADSAHLGRYTQRLLILCLASCWQPVAAATFTVDSVFDDGDSLPGDGQCDRIAPGPASCTLRAAIEEANATASSYDTIRFSIGPTTINVTQALPTISHGLRIDGRSAPGYNTLATDVVDAAPSVFISGSSLSGSADGFVASNVAGVSVDILGMGIINFPDQGIDVSWGVAGQLDGNWIGIARDGSSAGNDGDGVSLSLSERYIVGKEITLSATPEIIGIGNWIGNNGGNGVTLSQGTQNDVFGNWIGSGSGNPGNAGHGVYGFAGDRSMIGGIVTISANDYDQVPNYIDNNGGDGVHIASGEYYLYSNDINFNSGSGVSANGSMIRVGLNAQHANHIFNNGGHGVVIGNLFASSENLVAHNVIAQNSGRGVFVSVGDRNEIHHNTIYLSGNDAVRTNGNRNDIHDNWLGYSGGLWVQGNNNNGVVLDGDLNTVDGNIIAVMDDDGIDIVAGDGNQIAGNQIGASDSGDNWGNNTDGVLNSAGVRVRTAASHTVIENNTIGFNSQGLILEGSGTDVCANRIGVGTDNQLAGNDHEGIWVQGSANRIGDPDNGCAGNVIGDNGSDGIQVDGGSNIIRGNDIGRANLTDFGNGNGGILLNSVNAEYNQISHNVLSSNANDGVRVGATAGSRNRIELNEFAFNGDIGIDLNDDGPTANDSDDDDIGANNLQNTPVITALVGNVGTLTVAYQVDSNASNAAYPLSVDFYLSAGSSGQGYEHLLRDSYPERAASPQTNYEKTVFISLPAGTESGQLTAMVIDQDGNSSEFSVPMSFTAVPQGGDIFKDGFE